ncbi:hypothetical protein Tco_0800724 [Tanacetum coccineum]|uniref:Uncharacterized protein n=1 Tax=Tanacetum coccineum TaxID=301880 RepID=A0ABQ4ZWU7_9ASTR
MRQTKNLMDINIDALYNILKQNQDDVNEEIGHKKKAVVVTSDPLALVAEKTKNFYAKPTNNNLRTSSASYSANKKPEYVKSEEKKEDKKVDEKKRDMSKVKCYNCQKEGQYCQRLQRKQKPDGSLVVNQIQRSIKYGFRLKWKFSFRFKESSSSAEKPLPEVSYYTSDFEAESE